MDENIEHKNLSDAQVCFPKLKLIQVSFCKKLKSLLPVAWARMLPQLSVLDISHADKLKVVFSESSEEGTTNGQEIVIPNLEELKFIKLPSFVGICPGFKLHAVNLVKIVVDECPKFAPFIDATQVVPQPCKQSGPHEKISKEQEKNVIWSVKWMYLKQLQYLKYVGEEPTSVSLKNLICLRLQFPALQHFIAEDCSNFSPESFQLPLHAYHISGLYNEIMREDPYNEITGEVGEDLYMKFLCLNKDENDKAAVKHKMNIVSKLEVCLDVQREPWIPYFERFSPTPIMECGFGHNLDADLFIKGTRIWDEAKVRKLYTKKAADIILRNHLPESSKSGAYFIYHNNFFVNDSDLFYIDEKLENATLLQRHKFLWSGVLFSSLPVKSQLKRIFKFEKYSTCFLCSQAPETVDHLFLQCSFVRSLWFASPWGFRTDHYSGLRMSCWFNFLTNHSKELLLYASVMMDKVWDERNRIAHASNSNPPDILRVANSLSVTYFEMKNKLLPDMQEVVDVIMCPDGWFKAYFDVAMTEEESWAAALLLNHEGNLIGARTRKLSTKFLLEQEAFALELAVELAYDVVPKSNICLQGRRERVINILQDYLNDKMDEAVWYLEPVLMDVRDKIGSMGDWEVKIFRNFNWVAYNAAKWAAFCNSEGDVLNSVPAIKVLNSVPEIEVFSKEDFASSFFTNDADEHVHDSDSEDDDGLLRLKLKEVFTHDDGNNDDKKNNENGNNGNE
ncbi:hypothetical protein L6164_017155 [Bauhinia variegata]|uniref:Uncharacterized protein n=1 Tax=Bauhinia variegata TaxID=167791 RepID=A0ACB9N8B7_BAUVA|nr:hypothetical protein L6164_017155 [Bauhinia variegata]